MGLLGKMFGGGINAKLDVPDLKKGAEKVAGELLLSSKEDQVVNKVKFDFALIRTTASTVSPDDVSDIKVLGSSTHQDQIAIKGGEEKKVGFSVSIDWKKAEMKGLNKAILDFAKISESAKFLVTAQIKVRGSLVPKNIDQVVNVSS